jgi:hypothetical protein
MVPYNSGVINEGGGSNVREIDEERSRLRGKAQHRAASLRFSVVDAVLALQNRSEAVEFGQFKAEKGVSC